MIELKFRAWNPNTKKWLHSYEKLGGCSIKGEIILFGNWLDGVMCSELNSIIVEQYTGFMDKNGVDIYENDKVKGLNGKLREVGYNDRRSQFGLYSRELECWVTNELLSNDDWEVIGNTHEKQKSPKIKDITIGGKKIDVKSVSFNDVKGSSK